MDDPIVRDPAPAPVSLGETARERSLGGAFGSLELGPGLARRLRAWSAEAQPREACGFLIGAQRGRGWYVQRVTLERNVHPAPLCAFAIDPAATLGILEAAGAEGREVLGVWHSHPAGAAALPSRADARGVRPGEVLLVVARGLILAYEAGSDAPLALRVRAGGPTPTDVARDPGPLPTSGLTGGRG